MEGSQHVSSWQGAVVAQQTTPPTGLVQYLSPSPGLES